MKMWYTRQLALILGSCLALSMTSVGFAGTFFIDFNADGDVLPPGSGGLSLGTALGWDGFPQLVQGTAYALTDVSGVDNDVTITAIDDSFDPNNPAPPGIDKEFNGFPVPKEALDDYLFKRADTPGTSARIQFQNLDPGDYQVYVFEGHLTDSTQFAKLWSGDANGSNEPANENTGNFAQSFSVVDLRINPGDSLWYRHLEDGTGGISGMLIFQTTPEPSSALLAIVALFGLVRRCRR